MDKKKAPPNFEPKTIWTGDNLHVMRRMNSECVDLIYLDPPFNSQRMYTAPIGTPAEGTFFKDIWSVKDLKIEWVKIMEDSLPRTWTFISSVVTEMSYKSYLTYMSIRLLEMRRLLKPTGSIYLHIDPKVSHYLKIVMDEIFGRTRFLNELVWTYGLGGSSKNAYSRKHDIILLYTKTEKYTFHKPQIPATSQKMKGKMKGATDVWENLSEYSELEEDTLLKIATINNRAYERTGYKTQKPLALLTRIIEASSNRGDVVLDPFCGCATTCIAAEGLGRDWVGIDISQEAYSLIIDRVTIKQGAKHYKKENLKQTSFEEDVIHRKDIPQRTDLGKIPQYNCKENKRLLFGRQEGVCAGCTREKYLHDLEVDHITPIKHGGTDHIENLQLMCSRCNRIKGHRGMDYLKERLGLK